MSVARYDGHGMRLDLTLKSCTDGHPVILLAHQPTAAKKALDSPLSTNIELVLSGMGNGCGWLNLVQTCVCDVCFYNSVLWHIGKHDMLLLEDL